jgi:hypothetical protein
VVDGSVRPDVDVARATNDISSAIFGCAYLWTVLGDRYDLGGELAFVQARFVRAYGRQPRR